MQPCLQSFQCYCLCVTCTGGQAQAEEQTGHTHQAGQSYHTTVTQITREQEPHYSGIFNIFHRVELRGYFFTTFSCERPESSGHSFCSYDRFRWGQSPVSFTVGEPQVGTLLTPETKFSWGACSNTTATEFMTQSILLTPNLRAEAFPRPVHKMQRFSMFPVFWKFLKILSMANSVNTGLGKALRW